MRVRCRRTTGRRLKPVRATTRSTSSGRRRLRHRDERGDRHHDVCGGAGGELQRAGEQPVLLLVEQALPPRLGDDRVHLLGGERRCELLLRLHPQQAQQQPRDGVQHLDQGRQHPGHGHQRRREHQRRALGPGDGEVLGHHFADAPRAGRPRSRGPARTPRGCSRFSGRPAASNGTSSRCANAGSATAPSPSEATVMPSCAHASMSERCSSAHNVVRADRLPRPLDGFARGSIWLRRAEMIANSAPTKNALSSSSPAASRSAPPLTARPPGAAARAGGRPGGRPSGPRAAPPPGSSTSSPTRGTRPSRAIT